MHIYVSGTVTVAALAAGGGNNNIQVVFKTCALFTNCKNEINNTKLDNDKDINVVMPMYNLKEYNNNYSKISGNLWQYHRDEPAFTDAGALDDFSGNSASFKFKQKITGSTGNDDIKAVQIMVPLKHLSKFGELLKCH